MSRPRVASELLAPIAGALALVLALGILILDIARGLGAPMTSSAILGAVAGGLAVWRHDRLPAIAAAGACLAGAVLVDLWGFGVLFVLPLLGMVAATARMPVRPQPKHLAPPKLVATAFAAGPTRRSEGALRRARAAVVSMLIRPSEPEHELRRSA